MLAVLESRGMPPGERHSRTRELLDELGIAHIAGQPACREFAPWQREANDATLAALKPYWSSI